MTEDHAMHNFTQICLGLVAVHARGLTHKDLKPENIYFDCFGRLKIGGLVRVTTKKTKVPAPLLNYLAPEVHQGLAVSQSADIWSLGVLLYEMLSGGKLPFTGDTEAATWKSVVSADPPALPPHVSSDVKKLVTILLSKSADRRPSVDQIVLTKLVTRYVKSIVGYGRMAKNQYEVIKGPVSGEEEVEGKASMPRTKRAPVKEEATPKTAEKKREAVVEGGAGKPEEKAPGKGSKEEVKAEKKVVVNEAPAAAKKEAEAPR